MGIMTEEQKKFFAKLDVKRAHEIDSALLCSMTGPIVDGVEKRDIIDFFVSDKYLNDDKNGALASFVILTEEGLPLGFFSLRCGELFEETSARKMQICHNAYIALHVLLDERSKPGTYKKDDLDAAMNYIRQANDEGLGFDDFEPLEDKKKA